MEKKKTKRGDVFKQKKSATVSSHCGCPPLKPDQLENTLCNNGTKPFIPHPLRPRPSEFISQ